MNSILKYALITCLTLLFIHPSVIFSKQCNDLILILDPNGEETTSGPSNTLSFTFLDALEEATAPIITTNNIVNNFCFWKSTYKTALNQIKEEAIQTNNSNIFADKIKEILASNKLNKINFHPLFFLFLSLTDLTDDKWDCYLHNHTNLVLLIPKNYSKQYDYDPLLCGFDSRNFTKASTLSPESLSKQLHYSSMKNSVNIVTGTDIVTGIQSMLTERLPDTVDQKSWNIYLIGHGRLAEEKQTALMDSVTNKINLWLGYNENVPAKELNAETAKIGELSFNDFLRLMTVFNNHIKTSFLHYCTCFGGGYNKTLVNESLQELQANFIVSTQGISE